MSLLEHTFRTPWPLVAVLALGACDPVTSDAEFTIDQRIDMAGEDDDRVQSEKPQMCVNDLGHVFVMWADDRAGGGTGTGTAAATGKQVLWMNRSLSFGEVDTWLPAPARINQGDGNVASARMICDDNGAYVVWQDDRDGELKNPNVYFQRSDDGETWLAEDVRVSPDPDGDTLSINPDIAIDKSGNLYVAWADSQSGSYDILVGTSNDGGATWGPTFARVDQDPPGEGWSGNPRIAVNDSGDYVWVTWMDKRDGKSDIYVAYSDSAGSSFRPEERLDNTLQNQDGASDSFEPQLCTDGESSHVYVVWHDRMGESAQANDYNDIYYNYSADLGANWKESATRLDTGDGFGNSQIPQCSAAGDVVHVAWQDDRFIGYDIFYRTVTGGDPDFADVRLDVGTQQGDANSIDVRLARYEDTVVVGWVDGRAEAEAAAEDGEDGTGGLGYSDLYYNYRLDGAAMVTEQDFRIDSLLPGQSAKKHLNVAVLGGEIYAAWEDGRNGTKDIFFQRHVLGEEGTPPPVEDGGGSETDQ